MVVNSGYVCKKCGKVYNKEKQNLPTYCKKCGAELVREKYLYNRVERNGEYVETRDTNMFGGYDYVKVVLSGNIERVKIKRKLLFWWRLFKG